MTLRSLGGRCRQLASLGAAVGVAWSCAPAALARVVDVKDNVGLLSALQRAEPGDTIALKPGEYTPFIKGFHGSATITSSDPANEAVFKSLNVRDSSGLSFVGLTFSTEGFPAESYGAAGTIPFKIVGSSNIILSNLNVHGATPGSLTTDEFGLSVRGSQHVTLEGSNFHHLHGGFLHLDDDFLTLKNNDFHDLRDDAIRGGGSSDVLITGNHCHNNHPDGDLDKDHPDCIQFWTSNTKTSAHDIIISGNRYEREHGHATQFIFMGNENNIPYNHVVIKDNISTGSLWNAITIANAHDVTIVNNMLTSLCAPESGQTNIAWIRTVNITGLVMKNNQAGSYLKQGINAAVQESHNTSRGCIK